MDPTPTTLGEGCRNFQVWLGRYSVMLRCEVNVLQAMLGLILSPYGISLDDA